MVIILKKDKETKNTIRFTSEEDVYKNIYLQKSEVEELGSPERVQMTIEPVK